DLDQHGFGAGKVRDAERDRPEPLDLVLCRNRALLPGMGRRAALVDDEAEALALAVLEIERCAPAGLADLACLHPVLGKARLPPVERCVACDAQPRAGDAVRAAPLVAYRPVEEGEVAAGRGEPVGIEEMVGA